MRKECVWWKSLGRIRYEAFGVHCGREVGGTVCQSTVDPLFVEQRWLAGKTYACSTVGFKSEKDNTWGEHEFWKVLQ